MISAMNAPTPQPGTSEPIDVNALAQEVEAASPPVPKVGVAVPTAAPAPPLVDAESNATFQSNQVSILTVVAPVIDTKPPAAPATEVAATEPEPRIGRFTRTQLEAMRGQRGRKPSEYYQLFPPAIPAAVSPKAKPVPKKTMSSNITIDDALHLVSDDLAWKTHHADAIKRKAIAAFLAI